ncbi:MAG: ribosomal protein S18-alanine N-acetyltransferase, partial [Syntrophomonadaceae bacterium]|nr:ribosomal protein S18-alanine N-acetyltransferase [Syntrophomonadaceae bacterium]
MQIDNYIIRKMTENDIPQVMKIEQESFTIPWSKESYLGELKNNFATYLVCDYEGDVAAYGGIWVVFEEAHITNIAVGTNFRRQGMGKRLMLELENVARKKKALKIILEVRPSNDAALNLYSSLDYMPTGLRKNYYS